MLVMWKNKNLMINFFNSGYKFKNLKFFFQLAQTFSMASSQEIQKPLGPSLEMAPKKILNSEKSDSDKLLGPRSSEESYSKKEKEISQPKSKESQPKGPNLVHVPPIEFEIPKEDIIEESEIYILTKEFRTVKPYQYEFTSYVKGRWIGKPIFEVFSTEFLAYSQEYYVRHLGGDLGGRFDELFGEKCCVLGWVDGWMDFYETNRKMPLQKE